MGKNDYGPGTHGSGWAGAAFRGAATGGGRKAPEMGPGRRVVYRPDHASFGEFILSEHMRNVTAEVAKDIAEMAARLTGRDESSAGPHMADQFAVEREAGTMKVDRSLRVQVDVINTDPRAVHVEFGTQHTPRKRMLGRAGAAFGDFKHGKTGPARQDGTF